MRKTTTLLLGLLLFACETREHAQNELAALDKAKSAARAATARASAGQSEAVGIPACDKYARAYETCLNDKVPENERAELQKKFDERRNKWRDEVILRHPLEPVEEDCRNAMAESARTMSQYGCMF